MDEKQIEKHLTNIGIAGVLTFITYVATVSVNSPSFPTITNPTMIIPTFVFWLIGVYVWKYLESHDNAENN